MNSHTNFHFHEDKFKKLVRVEVEYFAKDNIPLTQTVSYLLVLFT
jgi:hypothetical protein